MDDFKMDSMSNADSLPTPTAGNRSGGAFDDAESSGIGTRARVAFLSPVKEDSETPEISNPQDAVGELPTMQGSENKEAKKSSRTKLTEKRTRRNKKPQINGWKRPEFKTRKRGRVVRVVSVENSNGTTSVLNSPPLPGNQYRTTLRRKAIHKLEEGASLESGANPEDYGDVSLGMKLIVVAGRVVVQNLNALSDGRASPAQLAGVIKRGDVLLAIGHLSLVNLPLDPLLTGLKTLSAPGPKGTYKQILDLRFEAGAGIELLKSHEEQQSVKNQVIASAQRIDSDAANDVFSLFPMVDQLSGAPLFDEADPEHRKLEQNEEHGLGTLTEESEIEHDESSKDIPRSEEERKEVSLDDLISFAIADQQKLDRERYASEFFNWSEELSELLRKTVQIVETAEQKEKGMTKSERVELGLKVMKLAKALAYNMEDIDKGKDLRSFKTWSTNFSLRSGASARRRYILDAASLRSSVNHSEVTEPTDGSVDSSGSGSLESVDGDFLLLGLAAHDGIWRKQVIDALKQAIDEMENEPNANEEEVEVEKDEKEATPDIGDALSQGLGNFLFGQQMSLIVAKKKKTFVLPPKEVTTVLFDLTTIIATSTPDEITVFGQSSNNFSFQSESNTMGKSKAALRADYILANLFMLEDALPVWLKSFRPFPLDQRRLLWPRMHNSTSASHAGNTLVSDNDSLTVESWEESSTKTPAKTRDLREIIEDQELDIETRAETCFLVTYYFTQQILTQYSKIEKDAKSNMERLALDEEAKAFVKKYGAYLQLHSCLSYSAVVKAEAPIGDLLIAASHDPTHRDATKEIQRANALIFYDEGKLSAVLKFLNNIRYESREERRNVIRDLCFSAYPDVQPWQVRKACMNQPSIKGTESGAETLSTCTEECLSEFYYNYLSMLLHPSDGHPAARHDAKLVKEWCEWSIGVDSTDGRDVHSVSPERLKHFWGVASRASSDHLAYYRDLIMLLDMSMTIGEYDLVLDLGGEIVENKKLASDIKNPNRVLECLRKIGMDAIPLAHGTENQLAGFKNLKRVLRLFQQMATSSTRSCRESVVVGDELYAFLKEWKRISDSDADDSAFLGFVDFLSTESTPGDVLHALVLWSASNDLGDDLFSQLDSLLRRGVHVALKSELSGSLLRLKHARSHYTEENKVDLSKDNTEAARTPDGTSIWRQMEAGSLSIDK